MCVCYNDYVMDRNSPNLWFLRIAVGLVLLTALMPVFHLLSMQSGQLQMSSETIAPNGDMSKRQNIPVTCCNDTFGSFSSMCAFVMANSACADYRAGTDKVAFSTFSIQISNREIVTPPPKA